MRFAVLVTYCRGPRLQERPAHGAIEQARHGEHAVANLLGVESASVEMREQPVFGVFLKGNCVWSRTHPVRGRVEDQPVQVLDGPAIRDELCSRASRAVRGASGRSPSRPKLSGERTSPAPKCPAQTRFTMTRAVSGWSGRVSHSANSRRPLRSAPSDSGLSPAMMRGNRRGASAPSVRWLPRRWTRKFSPFASSTAIASSTGGLAFSRLATCLALDVRQRAAANPATAAAAGFCTAASSARAAASFFSYSASAATAAGEPMGRSFQAATTE